MQSNMNVVFICTGNTCRSCMAEGIFRAKTEKLERSKELSTMSRGIHAFDGDAASEHSVNALKTLWDIDISVHKAKMLDNNDVEHADLLLTMTRQHRDILRKKYPGKKANIFTLKEYVYNENGADSADMDITDPFGMPYQQYESCAKEIYDCVNLLLEKID